MNIKQAKLIPLTGILQQLGVDAPVRRSDGLWYLSPLHVEKTASFKVHPERNIWYDHGLGHGGTVIEFALQYFNCASVSDALRELEQFSGVRGIQSANLPLLPDATPLPLVGERRTTAPISVDPVITIEKVQPLQHKALVQYIEKRGIPLAVARPFVREAYYHLRGKDRLFFALAFANDSGNYELRNKYFQGVSGGKDISLILPETSEQFEVIVFEGFLDFVSALVSWGVRAPQVPVLVLNSVALKDKAVATIHQHGFTDVRLYLDRDDSGRRLTREFQALEGLTVVDASGVYEGYKDFNEKLVKERSYERT